MKLTGYQSESGYFYTNLSQLVQSFFVIIHKKFCRFLVLERFGTKLFLLKNRSFKDDSFLNKKSILSLFLNIFWKSTTTCFFAMRGWQVRVLYGPQYVVK